MRNPQFEEDSTENERNYKTTLQGLALFFYHERLYTNKIEIRIQLFTCLAEITEVLKHHLPQIELHRYEMVGSNVSICSILYCKAVLHRSSWPVRLQRSETPSVNKAFFPFLDAKGWVIHSMSLEVNRKAPMTSRWFRWPKRIDICLLSFVAMLVAYCDRVNLSVTAPLIMQEYGWDTAQMGWVLSGFFMGYTILMIPAGRLVDYFGPKRVFAASVAWWSIFTALTPWASSVAGLTCLRAVMGAGQSGTFPSINRSLVNWFPRQEYSRAFGFCYSGGLAGPILAFPLASALLHAFGWRAVFFVFAILGFIWLPFWLLGASNTPETCTSIRQLELDQILSARPPLPAIQKVPWVKLLHLPPFWALLMLHFSSNWFLYVIVSWLPSYLMLERHFSLTNMTIGSTLPFVSALLSCNIWAALIDHLSKTRERARVRKIFLVPFTCAAGLLLFLPRVSSPIGTVIFLCIAMVLYTSVISIYTSGSIEIAPRYAGTVGGIQNCFANFAGVLVPVIVGYAVKISGWASAFWVTAAVSWLGVSLFLVFGKSEKLLD